MIFESWFPKHKINFGTTKKVIRSIQNNSEFKSLGPFSLPYYLEELKENNNISNVCSINYSPFLNRYSSIVLSV